MRILNALLPVAAVALGFAAVSLTARAEDPKPESGTAGGIMDMDTDFLREKLLKLWIIETASDSHNQRRIAEKSFKGLTPLDPTGDAERDAENRAEYLKNDKHLRHYMLLELDSSIEAIDIARHTLGIQLKPPQDDRAIRSFLEQELPEITWRNSKLEDAMLDLGRKIGTPVDFSGVGERDDVRIDLHLDPGFQLQQALEYVIAIHPIEWKYEGGRLIIHYMGSD